MQFTGGPATRPASASSNSCCASAVRVISAGAVEQPASNATQDRPTIALAPGFMTFLLGRRPLSAHFPIRYEFAVGAGAGAEACAHVDDVVDVTSANTGGAKPVADQRHAVG